MKPTKAQELVKNMQWMINSSDEVEAMTKTELIGSLCEFDTYHVSSFESWVFSEVVFRMSYPCTWRIRRWWMKVDAKYQTCKYFRRMKK